MNENRMMQNKSYLAAGFPERENSLGETGFVLIDIHETKESFIIEAEIPGVSTEDMEVFMAGKNLVIQGVKNERVESEGKLNFFCMERSFGPFKRIIEIPSPIVSNRVKADYHNGMLIITLPKSEERRVLRRKITINTF